MGLSCPRSPPMTQGCVTLLQCCFVCRPVCLRRRVQDVLNCRVGVGKGADFLPPMATRRAACPLHPLPPRRWVGGRQERRVSETRRAQGSTCMTSRLSSYALPSPAFSLLRFVRVATPRVLVSIIGTQALPNDNGCDCDCDCDATYLLPSVATSDDDDYYSYFYDRQRSTTIRHVQRTKDKDTAPEQRLSHDTSHMHT